MKAVSYCGERTMNQILSKFADNSPIFQQTLTEYLHNWGMEVTPTNNSAMVYAVTIPLLPVGRDCARAIEQNYRQA